LWRPCGTIAAPLHVLLQFGTCGQHPFEVYLDLMEGIIMQIRNDIESF